MIQRVYYDAAGIIFQRYIGHNPEMQSVPTAFGYLDIPIDTYILLDVSRVVNGEVIT